MSGTKVLIVDDNDATRLFLEDRVREVGQGVAISSFSNLPDAFISLDEASQSKEVYDFLITDLAIGKLTVAQGIKAIKEIREKFPNLKVIAVTGKESSAKDVYDAGAFAFFRKPDYIGLRATIKYSSELEEIEKFFLDNYFNNLDEAFPNFFNIVEKLDVGICVVDRRMKTLYLNQKQIEMSRLKDGKTALVGRLCYEIFEPGAQEVCQNCPLRSLFIDNEEKPHFTFHRKDEYHRVTALPLRIIGSEVIAAVKMSVDITTREEFETFRKAMEGELKLAIPIQSLLKNLLTKSFGRPRVLLPTHDNKYIQGFQVIEDHLDDFEEKLESFTNFPQLKEIIDGQMPKIFKTKITESSPFWQALKATENNLEQLQFGLVPMKYGKNAIGAIYVDEFSPQNTNGDITRKPRRINLDELRDYADAGARAIVEGFNMASARQAIELMEFDRDIYIGPYDRELFKKILSKCIQIIQQQYQYRIIPKKPRRISGHVMEVDGNFLRRVVEIGQDTHKYLSHWNLETDIAVPSVKAVITEKEIIYNKADSEPEWRNYLKHIGSLKNSARATDDNLSDLNALNSIACFPLMVDGKAVGVLSLQARVSNLFNETTLELVRAFVQRASIALKNFLDFNRIGRYPQMSHTMALAKEVSFRKKDSERTIFALLSALTHPEGLAFDRAIFYESKNGNFTASRCISRNHEDLFINEEGRMIPSFDQIVNGPIEYDLLPDYLPSIVKQDIPPGPLLIKKGDNPVWDKVIKTLSTNRIAILPIGGPNEYEDFSIMDNHLSGRIISEQKLEMLKAIQIDYSSLFSNLEMIHQIEEESHQKGELLHVLTHRLSTDLSGVRLWLRGGINKEFDLDEGRLNVIAEKLWLTSSAISDVLRFSVIESGRLKDDAHFAIYDLKQILKDSLSEILIPENNRIKIKDIEHSIKVEADRNLLKHAFINLLDNAINYSPKDSPIEVNLLAKKGGVDNIFEDMVRIAFINQPIIKVVSEELKMVFHKFYRGENGKYAKGTGLGLYVVDNIVRAHGGLAGVSLRQDGCIVFYLEIPQKGERP